MIRETMYECNMKEITNSICVVKNIQNIMLKTILLFFHLVLTGENASNPRASDC